MSIGRWMDKEVLVHVTLQYCIGFAIYQHESATGIHVFPILNPPPSLYHPSGSSQCTSPKHPVLCIEPGLVTRFIYDIIHVSMPFSQIILPSPSPIESLIFVTACRIFSCGMQDLVPWPENWPGPLHWEQELWEVLSPSFNYFWYIPGGGIASSYGR